MNDDVALSAEIDALTFKVIEPHNDSPYRHGWMWPNGWRGIGPVENRDKRGYAQGERVGYYPPWFVLACNNIDCPGRAVVPVQVLTDHADAHDTRVTPSGGPS